MDCPVGPVEAQASQQPTTSITPTLTSNIIFASLNSSWSSWYHWKKRGQPMLPMKKTSLKWTRFFQRLSKFKCTPPTYVQFHLENPHRNPNTSSFQGRKFTGFSTSLNIGSWEHPTKWYTTTIYYIYIHNLQLHYQVLWNIIMQICCIFLNVFCLIPFGSEWNNWYDSTFRPTCVGNTHVNGWSCKFTSKN